MGKPQFVFPDDVLYDLDALRSFGQKPTELERSLPKDVGCGVEVVTCVGSVIDQINRCSLRSGSQYRRYGATQLLESRAIGFDDLRTIQARGKHVCLNDLLLKFAVDWEMLQAFAHSDCL